MDGYLFKIQDQFQFVHTVNLQLLTNYRRVCPFLKFDISSSKYQTCWRHLHQPNPSLLCCLFSMVRLENGVINGWTLGCIWSCPFICKKIGEKVTNNTRLNRNWSIVSSIIGSLWQCHLDCNLVRCHHTMVLEWHRSCTYPYIYTYIYMFLADLVLLYI